MPELVNISVGSLRGTRGEDWHDPVVRLGEVVDKGGADVVEVRHGVRSALGKGQAREDDPRACRFGSWVLAP